MLLLFSIEYLEQYSILILILKFYCSKEKFVYTKWWYQRKYEYLFLFLPSSVSKIYFPQLCTFKYIKNIQVKKKRRKKERKEKKKKGIYAIRSSSYRCLPLPGIYRFRNRQSSLWLVRNMYKRFSCWYLPRGICNKAAVSLLMSGKCCGQTAPNESASLIPSHGIGEIGGRKRKSPTGGAAYGMPRNTSTGSKCLLFKSCEKLSRC